MLLRDNLDVMYVEKNVRDNVAGNLLEIDEKTKDNLNAQKDAQKMCIRDYLIRY